jgi:hypothetical protein
VVTVALISVEENVPAKGPDLPSFRHPSDECTCGGADRERHRNSLRKVSLYALG